MVDYHVHPNTFKGGTYHPDIVPLRKYLDICRRKNISEIGFSEHGPRFHPTYNHTALRMEDIPVYIETLQTLQQETPDIKIKIGIEIDYTPESEEIWRKVKSDFELDFIACSIHYLDDWLPTKDGMLDYLQSGKSIEALYTNYYQRLQQAAQSEIFSFMAHPDLVKIHAILNHLTEPLILKELWTETCQVLKDHAQCIELDSGWKNGSLNTYRPEWWMLQIAHDYDIPITLGSDAHHPGQVGTCYPEIFAKIQEIGYNRIAVFNHYTMSLMSIL